MWLIDTTTLCLEWFPDELTVEYAILSHTWNINEPEITFRDMQNLSEARFRRSFSKIDRTCFQARSDGIRYAWIDSCCINKDASAELSEAINSMFKWYQNSKVCYAYLSDYTHTKEELENDIGYLALGSCKWFTRGWTLQELIASDHLKFFNSAWECIGDKGYLVNILARITGIETIILTSFGPHKQFALRTMSVATRMSWASKRQTTRQEDEAYALMGIFSVNMPLLYGEGKGAFRRLQEHIMAKSTDHSILLWRATSPLSPELFAPSPASFRGNEQVVQYIWNNRAHTEFTLTNMGIRMLLPVVRLRRLGFCAVLSCRYADDFRGPILLPLIAHSDNNPEALCVRKQPVPKGKNDRFPVLQTNGDNSMLEKITKKSMLLIESYTGYPMILMQRANVFFKLSPEFAGMFTVAEVIPEGKFNSRTQTLSWLTLQSRSSEVVSGSITWLSPGGTGIKLLLVLDHRWRDHSYQIELMEVQQSPPNPQSRATTNNSIETIRHLGAVGRGRSYLLDVGTLHIEAKEMILLMERTVSISITLRATNEEEVKNLPEEVEDKEPPPNIRNSARPSSNQDDNLPISSNGSLPFRPRL